jgi:predicted GNAT family acetyltransferase
MDIMEIRKINEIKPVEGKTRLVSGSEAKLIADWLIQYQLESLASEMDYEAALKKANDLIENKNMYVYENSENKAVSMAATQRKLKNGMAISMVFTPEEFRGKGYAAANIYYLSKELLENGCEFCTIFADKKNPVSNRAYEKVGYIILEENYDYSIMPAEIKPSQPQ